MKKDELQNFDGKEGRKAYVSHLGKVYDVTDSRLWKNGKHVNKHFAGMDLSEAIKAAPHGPEVLGRYAQVGEIEMISAARAKEERTLKTTIRSLYRVFHPHPMLIHFPMGLLSFVLIMQIIFQITKRVSFETAAYYGLCTATVFMVPTIVSGFVSWWVNYEMTKNKIFEFKITFSFILLFMCATEIYLRTAAPEVAYGLSGTGLVYNAMLFLNIPVLAVIGFNGGKLSWG